MFKMNIALDEVRMESDGLDVAAAWERINDMIVEAGNIKLVSKGVFQTENHSNRSLLMMLLRDTEWFMKYVNYWIIEDETRREDVIESYKEMGLKCCYE